MRLILPAGHPIRATVLSNLGITLRIGSEHTGSGLEDLDAAVEASQEAVHAITAEHPRRGAYLSNFGNTLRSRFERTNGLADLDAAIATFREAVQATPSDHPDRTAYLSNLGDSLQARFRHTGTAADRDAALEMYEEAAGITVAAPSERIEAARRGASLVAEADPTRTAGLLEAAVLLLPQTAPRFLERGDQQYAIGRFPGLAADAAALALSDPTVPEPERPRRALRLLEAARGVLLSQTLSTRGDLSELRDRHPDLATRFVELRALLDQPSQPTGTDRTEPPDGGDTISTAERIIRSRRQAHEEFTKLLAQIRGLEGFSGFALPPSAEQLERQAVHGPVVILNVSAYRSDAILLTSEGITSQHLPRLTQASVTAQVTAFCQAPDTPTAIEILPGLLASQVSEFRRRLAR